MLPTPIKKDLVTKQETSPVVDGANKSSRHYTGMALPVLFHVETLLGQGQDQNTLSLWISRPIRFHGTGKALTHLIPSVACVLIQEVRNLRYSYCLLSIQLAAIYYSRVSQVSIPLVATEASLHLWMCSSSNCPFRPETTARGVLCRAFDIPL